MSREATPLCKMHARLFIQREKHVSPHCGLQAVLLRNPAGKCLIGIFLTKMSLREWSCDIPEEREERFGTGPREAALHTVKRGHAQLLSCGMRHLCGASATRPAQRHSREPSGDRTV